MVGRSNIVGKPVAQLLLQENCTVTICHSRTRDLAAVCRRGDILVAAVGKPQMVKGDWVKPGACVIDVGINRVAAPEKGEGKSKLVGDVDFEAAARVAGAITPVPGGVGPMTIAMLMANTRDGGGARGGAGGHSRGATATICRPREPSRGRVRIAAPGDQPRNDLGGDHRIGDAVPAKTHDRIATGWPGTASM